MKKHFTRAGFPATRRVTAAGVAIGDFVKKGGIKGFALEATRTASTVDGSNDSFDDIAPLAGTVLIGFGEVEAVTAVAVAAGGGIAEGDYLLWDATLDANAGAFTDDGASAAAYDAIAGFGAVVADGGTGTIQVLVPGPY